MFFGLSSRLLQRSFLMRLLQTTGLSLALMTASAAVVRAADANDTDIEIGADGAAGLGDPVFPNVPAGPGQPAAANAAASSATGNATATATATGGNGGISFGEGDDSRGGDASASSTAKTTGSGDASSSASATGGGYGVGGGGGPLGFGGSATATADALATGSGSAFATAVARAGESDFVTPVPAANASSSAETPQGAMAEALSTISSAGVLAGTATSTAKTSLGGVSVQSDATNTLFPESERTVEAIAQGGSGLTSVDSAAALYAISTALPDKAYATTLIDSANNVAAALLGPDDTIFGTAVLGFYGSSTFDFSFRGDLLFGVIDDGTALLVTVNGAELSIGNPADDTVINLGSFGPNIELTIIGDGTFAFGGAVPEPSTWSMLLLGFAGLGLVGYRQKRGAKPQPQVA
jgi:PEP-CTERM motif